LQDKQFILCLFLKAREILPFSGENTQSGYPAVFLLLCMPISNTQKVCPFKLSKLLMVEEEKTKEEKLLLLLG
jgi:hypothetical protein